MEQGRGVEFDNLHDSHFRLTVESEPAIGQSRPLG